MIKFSLLDKIVIGLSNLGFVIVLISFIIDPHLFKGAMMIAFFIVSAGIAYQNILAYLEGDKQENKEEEPCIKIFK